MHAIIDLLIGNIASEFSSFFFNLPARWNASGYSCENTNELCRLSWGKMCGSDLLDIDREVSLFIMNTLKYPISTAYI